MIFDHIDNLSLYKGLHQGLDRVIETLEQVNFRETIHEQAVGKYSLDEHHFYLVQSYTPKDEVDGRLETHQKYIDLQWVVDGHEKMGVANKRAVEATTVYSESDDIQFHRGACNWLSFRPGYFAVFFPEDAHMPGIVEGDLTQVHKIVFKIVS